MAEVEARELRSGHPLKPSLLLLLDGCANIAPPPGLDEIASTAAALGVQLLTIFQDLSQVQVRWGNRAGSILNNPPRQAGRHGDRRRPDPRLLLAPARGRRVRAALDQHEQRRAGPQLGDAGRYLPGAGAGQLRARAPAGHGPARRRGAPPGANQLAARGMRIGRCGSCGTPRGRLRNGQRARREGHRLALARRGDRAAARHGRTGGGAGAKRAALPDRQTSLAAAKTPRPILCCACHRGTPPPCLGDNQW